MLRYQGPAPTGLGGLIFVGLLALILLLHILIDWSDRE